MGMAKGWDIWVQEVRMGRRGGVRKRRLRGGERVDILTQGRELTGVGLGVIINVLMLLRGTNVSFGMPTPPPRVLPESSRPWKRRVLPRRREGEEEDWDIVWILAAGRILSL